MPKQSITIKERLKETEMNSVINKKINKLNEEIYSMQNSIENIWNEFLKESDSVIIEVDKLIQKNENEMKIYKSQHIELISNDLGEITNYMKDSEKEFDQQKNEILGNFNSIENQFLEDLEEEEKNMKIGSEKLKKFIENVKDSSHKLFKEEKKNGEETFKNLLSLLENACSKIERTFINS